jgi:hypothetical protein
VTALAIGWVPRGIPKTEEQQEAGGNPENERDGACGTAEGTTQLEVIGRDERIILKRILKT